MTSPAPRSQSLARIVSAIIGLLSGIFCLIPPPAEGADLKTVIGTLEQGYRSLTDVQASFTQRSVIAGIDRVQKGAGDFAIRKSGGNPAMFRFTYTKPQKQDIICDGKTVWLYIPDSRQVVQMDTGTLFAGGNGMAISYLTGLGDISRDFSVAFARDRQDNKGNYLLELTPKKPSAVLSKLLLTVSGTAVEKFLQTGSPVDPFPVVSSTVIDAGGSRTTMEFSGAKSNKGISPARFTFKVPTGVDLIKQ